MSGELEWDCGSCGYTTVLRSSFPALGGLDWSVGLYTEHAFTSYDADPEDPTIMLLRHKCALKIDTESLCVLQGSE